MAVEIQRMIPLRSAYWQRCVTTALLRRSRVEATCAVTNPLPGPSYWVYRTVR